ncbi:MAG: lipopolysaccharide export system protein LptC [Burkholderiales bacterium]
MVMALMIVLALGSFWILEVMRRSSSDFVPTVARTDPDFYVEKFSYVKTSSTGSAQYHISGAKLTHNPKDDSYDIELPVINNKGSGTGSPMTVRADRAHVNSDNSKVHLYDNVRMDRPASAKSEPLHVRSEYMLVLPDEDVVQSDKPVEITLGKSVLNGTGMFANNATRELRLSSNVHGTYQARAR